MRVHKKVRRLRRYGRLKANHFFFMGGGGGGGVVVFYGTVAWVFNFLGLVLKN